MVSPGFAQPVFQAQSTFRAILDALARPGTIRPIDQTIEPPGRLSPAAAAVALTLCDHDTPVWLDEGLSADHTVSEWLRFHCGCSIASSPSAAVFGFSSSPQSLPPFDVFDLGNADYPDRSTTLVLQVESFDAGPGLVLTGPGINGQISLGAKPLPSDLPARLALNRSLFPRGVDLLLVSAEAVAGLPRSVRIVEK